MKMNRDEETKLISTNITNSNATTTLDEVDETRQRIEAWMGLGSNSKKTTTRGVVTKKNTTIPIKPCEQQSSSCSSLFDERLFEPTTTLAEPAPTPTTEGLTRPTLSSSTTGQSQRLKSILRSPKYSNRNLAANGELDDPRSTSITNTPAASSSSLEVGESHVPPLPMQQRVVERLFPVGQPLPQRVETPVAGANAALAIEGYTPLTTASTEIKPKVSFKEKNGNLDDDDDDSDASSIVLSSMDDLFDMARKSTASSSSNLLDRSMASLETDLEFSCMTAEEFEDLDVPEEERRVLQEEERRLQYEMFSGHMDAFDVGAEDGDESFHHDDEPNFLLQHSSNLNNDDDDDQALIDVSQPQDDENDVADDEDHVLTEEDSDAIVRQPSEARAFLLLWTAITQWVTPHSVALLEEWKGQEEAETSNSNSSSSSSGSHVLAIVADRSDVEASRCAGLQAMLKMNLPRIMEELHQPQELRRFLDIHLAELLSTFDYTYPISVKMDMDMWRAMTCVFVDMVLMFSSKEQQSKYVVAAANPKPLNNHTNSSGSNSNNNTSNNDYNNDSENKPNQDNAPTFPESAKAAGLKLEEYRYLVQSAITTLGPRQEQD